MSQVCYVSSKAKMNHFSYQYSICFNLQDKAHIKCLEFAFVYAQLSIVVQYEGFSCNCTPKFVRIMGIDLQILQ